MPDITVMLPRAAKIGDALLRALERSQKDIEIDVALVSVHFDVTMGRRTGMPVKVRIGTTRALQEIDLTDEK